MKYAIVYSSKTGNTEYLAKGILDVLPKEECVYFGAPSPEALQAERIYIGFWTDKGSCDEKIAEFLSSVTVQEVFLFGTAGFGGDAAYFQMILENVKKEIGGAGKIIGEYMCQGKMPCAVRKRFEAMEESPKKQVMLDNFDRALKHPNREDIEQLQKALQVAD